MIELGLPGIWSIESSFFLHILYSIHTHVTECHKIFLLGLGLSSVLVTDFKIYDKYSKHNFAFEKNVLGSYQEHFLHGIDSDLHVHVDKVAQSKSK